MTSVLVVVCAAVVAVAVALALRRDSVRPARLLRRVGLGTTIGYAVLTAVFVAGETLADPGGWRAAGLILAWAAPLTVLALLAWYRPAVATVVLVGATTAALGLDVSSLVVSEAWRTFEDSTGPVRALVSFVVAVPLGLLGRHRPAPAGGLLLALGVGPFVLAAMAGATPVLALASLTTVSVPPVLIGALYLLSAAIVAPRQPRSPAAGRRVGAVRR